ncbi:MAG: hypothetical protein WCT36_05910 [Candidatus Gracilibacteria bacterium]|jgi:hypothetical protein
MKKLIILLTILLASTNCYCKETHHNFGIAYNGIKIGHDTTNRSDIGFYIYPKKDASFEFGYNATYRLDYFDGEKKSERRAATYIGASVSSHYPFIFEIGIVDNKDEDIQVKFGVGLAVDSDNQTTILPRFEINWR